MSPGPDSLLLGETITLHGHIVCRVGLAGEAAYLVDGAALGLVAAKRAVEATQDDPVRFTIEPHLMPVVPVAILTPEQCARGDGTMGQRLKSKAHNAAAEPPAPRQPRRRARARSASPLIAEPELLQDVRDALVRQAFRCTHRRFDGGEAVMVAFSGPPTLMTAAFDRAIAQLLSAGFHVERGDSAGTPVLIVASTKGALSGGAPPKKTAGRARAGATS